MTLHTLPPEDPRASRRFAALVYSSFALFVVFLTVSYFFAGPMMDWMEAVIRRLFL